MLKIITKMAYSHVGYLALLRQLAFFAKVRAMIARYAHRFHECLMRRLKGCPDGSASMAQDYANLPV